MDREREKNKREEVAAPKQASNVRSIPKDVRRGLDRSEKLDKIRREQEKRDAGKK